MKINERQLQEIMIYLTHLLSSSNTTIQDNNEVMVIMITKNSLNQIERWMNEVVTQQSDELRDVE